jgi:hypothetical protein
MIRRALSLAGLRFSRERFDYRSSATYPLSVAGWRPFIRSHEVDGCRHSPWFRWCVAASFYPDNQAMNEQAILLANLLVS